MGYTTNARSRCCHVGWHQLCALEQREVCDTVSSVSCAAYLRLQRGLVLGVWMEKKREMERCRQTCVLTVESAHRSGTAASHEPGHLRLIDDRNSTCRYRIDCVYSAHIFRAEESVRTTCEGGGR